MQRLIKAIVCIALGASIWTSCSDLEPELTDVVAAENYFSNEDAFISALGAAYTKLYSTMNHGGLFSLQGTSSDEMAVTHKGPDWEDGGQWLRMHRHDFSEGEGVFNNVWVSSYAGINDCNRLIATFESVENPNSAAFIAELKSLRAYFYLNLLDVFGNVPIVTSFDVPEGFLPATESRQAVYDFVESELTTQVPLLSKSVDASTYGRVNYYAGQAMLTQLYMNAEVYTGTAQWAKAVTAADEIINDMKYNLESNYFTNFAVDNGSSKETILAIPYDSKSAGGFNMVQITLHYESQKTFNTVDQPWNGYCVLADFYNSFDDDDLRKKGDARGYGVMLQGPQYDAAGNLLIDNDTKWYADNADASLPGAAGGREVIFSAEINELAPGAWRDGGARIAKWEYENGTVNTMNNDVALYRYADILLSKAEALHRMNPAAQSATGTEAHTLTQMVVDRSNPGTMPSTLTPDFLLAERGRELCFENKRRTDLIRFDKWGDAWWEKGVSEPFKILMPIPASQIAINTNLVQNPGY